LKQAIWRKIVEFILQAIMKRDDLFFVRKRLKISAKTKFSKSAGDFATDMV